MSKTRRATRWLSEDLAALITNQAASPDVYDVVVIGSGYGGAMAAAMLAGNTHNDQLVRLCVLERGREYLPGAFKSQMGELPRSIRVNRTGRSEVWGEQEALFDFRFGNGVSALVANGLGGGSLINGAVMEKPKFGTFHSGLPPHVETDLTTRFLDDAKVRLGGMRNGQNNTIQDHLDTGNGLQKTRALQSIGGPTGFRFAALTIEMQGRTNQDGVTLNACTLCGDCMTGCNVGARESLDTNLLVQAKKNGAEIYTGATVLHLSRERLTDDSLGWSLTVVPTDRTMRNRQIDPLKLRARRVIVAAGTLGSTEILLRSQTHGLLFSPRLGEGFSCNGDNLLATYKHKQPVNATAEEHIPHNQRQVGPTITGILDMAGGTPQAPSKEGFLIQEFAVPAPLKRLFDEALTTANTVHDWGLPDTTEHEDGHSFQDPCAVNPDAVAHSALLGIIGHDDAAGSLRLPALMEGVEQGSLHIDWPQAGHATLLNNAHARVESLVRQSGVLKPDGRVLPNPVWRPVPDKFDFMVKGQRGPVLTVHPLGGCAMGNSISDGVVDDLGRVFDRNGENFDSSLMVLDGAILPGSLGANPALTIAALSMRATEALQKLWAYAPCSAALHSLASRPIFRTPEACFSRQSTETTFQIVERLVGPVRLDAGGDGSATEFVAELTLRYTPQTVAQLTGSETPSPLSRRITLSEDGDRNELRIFRASDWSDQRAPSETPIRFETDEDIRSRKAVLVATVGGSLDLFVREKSTRRSRQIYAFFSAYLRNRGMRDLADAARACFRGDSTKKQTSQGRNDNPVVTLWNYASRAGEVRLFKYNLTVQSITKSSGFALDDLIRQAPHITGHKKLTYSYRSNPWVQLTTLHLDKFPAMRCAPAMSTPATLHVDGRYLAKQGIPLLQIVQHHSLPRSFLDITSLGLYVLRLVLSVHLLNFRSPDAPQPSTKPESNKINRLLPQPLPGIPTSCFSVEELLIDRTTSTEGQPNIAVKVRLTRYRQPSTLKGPSRPPLVFIHGYSTSGTTFAHPALSPGLARYFWNHGRDVWVLDLRTSAGMPTARLPWAFEDAAFADIPVAIAHIVKVTGQPKVDVFAHCIGAVMVSMGLLTDRTTLAEYTQPVRADRPEVPLRYAAELGQMHTSIRKLVLSQKGPRIAYSDFNVFSGYMMRQLRRLVLPENYQFQPPDPPSLLDGLVDRLLATLPYPVSEMAVENPLWRFWRTTPWTRTRHRMDALYARDFTSANMSDEVLAHIDDFFGPMNLDTLAQAIHFTRTSQITRDDGVDTFYLKNNNSFKHWRKIPTMSLHGEDNGLADKATVSLNAALFAREGIPFKPLLIPGFGHQDCLIGKDAEAKVYVAVKAYLDA